MLKKFAYAAVLSLAVGACTDAGIPAGPARLAPFVQVSGDLTTQIVPNEYIVILRDRTTSDLNGAIAAVKAGGGTIIARYDETYRGFAAVMSPEVLRNVRLNAEVLLVQPNGIARARHASANPLVGTGSHRPAQSPPQQQHDLQQRWPWRTRVHH